MSVSSTRSSGSRTGATLLEVVAAVAIMGSLLVSVVVAIGQVRRRESESYRRLDAARALDQLLDGWYGDTRRLPTGRQGPVPDHAGLTWTITPVSEVEQLDASVVHVDISENSGGGTLASVEVIWPGRAP